MGSNPIGPTITNVVKVGNAAIDGVVQGHGWRMALEIKNTHDDIVRGLSQLVEALAHGYTSVA